MNPPLPIDGVLPPDLQGTLVRIGPGSVVAVPVVTVAVVAVRAAGVRAAASEEAARKTAGTPTTRGQAPSTPSNCGTAPLSRTSRPRPRPTPTSSGRPARYWPWPSPACRNSSPACSQPEEFDGGLRVPVASHVHRDAVTGGRILFGVEQGTETASPFLRIGEWDAAGALTHQMEVQLERATWQHDLGVTARHLAFIESPTEFAEFFVEEGSEDLYRPAVPYRWTPGAEGWIGVLDRDGDGSDVRWVRTDPCLVTHVLHAYDEDDKGVGSGGEGGRQRRGRSGGGGGRGDEGAGALCSMSAVTRYPRKGSRSTSTCRSSVPAGIGMSLIGGGLPVLERWRITGDKLERTQMDERLVEYVTSDPLCEGRPFRYGYGVEMATNWDRSVDREVDHLGLLRFDMARDEVTTWRPGQYKTASEPLFVRAEDGRSDDEGWLLTVVYDAVRGASDIYVLDASSLGRRPQAIIHLPEGAALPFRSHGTWISADRYR